MKEYIDIDKCSAFEQIILLLMANHKEDELREEDKNVDLHVLEKLKDLAVLGSISHI